MPTMTTSQQRPPVRRPVARLLLGAAIALSAIAPACSKSEPPSAARTSAEPKSTAEPHDPLGPPSQEEVPTTDGAIALGNLSGQIEALESLLRAAPGQPDNKRQLVSLLSMRGRYLARIADVERAAALAEELVRDAPKDPASYVARSSSRAAMHRFADALADLAQAEKLGTKAPDLYGDRAAIIEAQGDLEGALALRKKARELRADPSTLGPEASLLGQLGRTDEAAALFQQAARSYRGVSPFPIAWLFFNEGLLWERAGNAARARAFFTAALDRLPAYAHASSHLATLLPPARGVEILGPVAAASDDPELEQILAARMRSAGDAAGADARLAHARARYVELTDRHPEAYGEHLAWFLLDEGKEPARALDLAKKNLALRKTEKAYRLAILAALAAGARDEACALGKEAGKVQGSSEMLKSAAADACKPR